MDKELRFLAEKILERETGEFLREIERLMDEDGVGKVLVGRGTGNDKSPGRSQFQKLMDAAGEASCVEELLLFISYQKNKGGGWHIKCSNRKSIAENVAESFQKFQNKIYGMIEEEAGTRKIDDEEERLLRLEVIRKYMGYLYWKASVVSKN